MYTITIFTNISIIIVYITGIYLYYIHTDIYYNMCYVCTFLCMRCLLIIACSVIPILS